MVISITERERFVIAAAISYALANMDDVNEAMECDAYENAAGLVRFRIAVQGEAGEPLAEQELKRVLDFFTN